MIPGKHTRTFHSEMLGCCQRGSITVMFVFFALLLVGAISYALYTGQQVEKKIALQNASDTSSIAVANHASQGLNMISANNLALGGAIHVAGAVPVLAAYLSMGWVATSTGKKALEEALVGAVEIVTGGVFEPRNIFQEKIHNKLAPVSGFYMKMASGLTKYNDFMNRWWLVPAGLSGMEMHRVNLPGSLSLPFQKIRAPLPVYMQYEGIGKASPRSTICHSIKASAEGARAAVASGSDADAMLARDDFATWLLGPVASLPGANGINDLLQKIMNLKQNVAKVMPVDLGFVDCGFGFKTAMFAMIDVGAKKIEKQGPVIQSAVLLESGVDLTAVVMEVISTGIPQKPKKFQPRSPARMAWDSVGRAAIDSKKAAILLDTSGRPNNYAKYASAAYTLKSLREMHKKADSYSCDEAIEPKDRSVPVVENGQTVCIPIRNINPNCAMQEFIPQFASVFSFTSLLSDVTDLLRNFKAKHCTDYNRYVIDTTPGRDEEKKREYRDKGISIADWGKQSKAYGSGSSEVSAENRRETLGFLFPLNEQRFEDGNTFYTLSANALRTSSEYSLAKCPSGYTVKDSEGKARCEIIPLVGLASDSDHAQRSGDAKTKFDRDHNAMTAGMNKLVKVGSVAGDSTAGALSDVWSRVQWTTSGSKALFQRSNPIPGSVRNQLFWPAWKSHLSSLDTGTLKSMLETVSPKNDTTAGQVTALKAE